jgi:hypothetical protein
VTISLLALLPVVVAVGRAVLGHQMPLGDNGLISLRANDVLTANHPWFGTWTSASLSAGVDFNNPLPLHFDWLALWVKPFGLAVGSALGAATLNMAAILVAIRQGWVTSGRKGEALMAIVVSGLSLTLGSEMLTDVWQPHNLVLPFAAFLACCVAVASGRWSSLPWAVGIGSLVMGTHLSFIYVVLGSLASSVASGWWHDGHRDGGRLTGRASWRRQTMWAALVGLAAWSQALIELFVSSGRGNIARLLDAQKAGTTPLGGRLAVRLFAQVVALPPWWLRGSFTGSIPATTKYSAGRQLHPAGVVSALPALLAVAAVFVVLSIALARTRKRGDVAGVALVWTALCGSVLAMITLTVMPAGVIGLASHQMRWLWPISALVSVAALHVFDLSRSARRLQQFDPRLTWLPVAVVGVLSCANLPAHLSDLGPAVSRAEHGSVRTLMVQLEAVHLPGVTYFDGSTLQFAEPYSGAVLAALLDADQPVRAGTASFARQLGERRHRLGDERWSIQIRTGAAAETLGDGEEFLAVADSAHGSPIAVVLIDHSPGG